jgi:hypothetical protein
MQPPAHFEAEFPPESIETASKAFRDYLFRRYGVLLVGAFVINAAGLAVVYWSGAERGLMFGTLAFALLVLFPVWFLYKYTVGPRLHAAALRQLLPSRGSVNLGKDFVVLPTRDGGTIELSWSGTKIVEHPSLFLLVRSPFMAYYVPKQGMPAAIEQIVQAKAARSAA